MAKVTRLSVSQLSVHMARIIQCTPWKPNNSSILKCGFERHSLPLTWADFVKFTRECQFNQRKFQNGNVKIDVTGKVHPRQASSRPPAVQTSRMGCHRRQVRQGFLLSVVLLGLPWKMNEDDTQNPNSGEARHATRQGSRPWINFKLEKDRKNLRSDFNQSINRQLRLQKATLAYNLSRLQNNSAKNVNSTEKVAE